MKRTVCRIVRPQLRLTPKTPFYLNKSILNKLIINNKTVTIKNYSNNILLLRNTEGTINDKVYFPYGKADFDSIRKSKQFYVDKTNFIPLLERNSQQLFLVRPPRWGKSLFLSMLASYYDVNKKDEFNELFSGLWIGEEKNWTPGKNQFHILKLDFSNFIVGKDLISQLQDNINDSIHKFLIYYNLVDEVKIDSSSSYATFLNLVFTLKHKKEQFMVLTDGYDSYANKLMFENPEKLVTEGKIKELKLSPIISFFEQLKRASGIGLQNFRSIITGVIPIPLDDGMSGYNVSNNISFDGRFSDLVGFTENDLRRALDKINIIGIDQDVTISTMKKYYKGYYFRGSEDALFHTNVSLFFLNKIKEDENFRNAVLQKQDIPISTLTDTVTVIADNVFSTLAKRTIECHNIIQQLLSKDCVEVKEPICTLLNLKEVIDQPDYEEINILSFMYYTGMVTLTEESSKRLYTEQLVIPNEVMKVQYLKQFQKFISLSENDVTTFINEPSEENLKILLHKILEKLETIHFISNSDVELQACFETALRAYCLFRNDEGVDIQIEKEVNSAEYLNNKENVKPARLLIKTSKDIFIIDIKLIRLNDLTKYKDIEYWYPELFETMCTDLKRHTDDELLEKEVITHSTKEKVLARSVLDSAISQVKQCAKYDNSRNVHKFVVLQVGWPLIVRKVD
ncbi:hypothetical protein ABK040_004584 [Willaertia magna]